MLKTAFGEHRHIQAGDGFHAACDYFAFQSIKLFDVHPGESLERNAFRHVNDTGPREWAESGKAVMAGWRVSAEVASAQATAVGERMLDSPNAPALLVKHQIVHDAANSQLRVFLDWV